MAISNKRLWYPWYLLNYTLLQLYAMCYYSILNYSSKQVIVCWHSRNILLGASQQNFVIMVCDFNLERCSNVCSFHHDLHFVKTLGLIGIVVEGHGQVLAQNYKVFLPLSCFFSGHQNRVFLIFFLNFFFRGIWMGNQYRFCFGCFILFL